MEELKLNTIYNEDCLETMKKIKDKSVNLIIADFPYFEVKGDFDFIWKDFNEFLEWVEVCAKEFKRILSDNGSLYVYGHAKKIAYKQIIFDKYFNIENQIVWEKTVCQTKAYIDEFRSYAPIKEHILFYSQNWDISSLERIEKEFIAPRNPFSFEIKKAMKKYNIKEIDFRRLRPSKTGGLTGWCSNIILGTSLPTKKDWIMLNELVKSSRTYEDLRKEYEDLRRPFNNKYKLEDVMKFDQQSNITGKYDHPTQKPPKLSKALIETSTRKGDLVYIPFGGSGVEVEQCQILGLVWITGDLEKSIAI